MTEKNARNAILARRAKFVAAALATAGLSQGCGGAVESTPTDGGVDTADARPPQACLSATLPDAFAQPCLSRPPDDVGPEVDAAPQPCLDYAPPDAGPAPCLGVAYDAGVDTRDTSIPVPCLSAPIGDGG